MRAVQSNPSTREKHVRVRHLVQSGYEWSRTWLFGLLFVDRLFGVAHHHKAEIGGFSGILIGVFAVLSDAILQRERLKCGLKFLKKFGSLCGIGKVDLGRKRERGNMLS